MNLDEFHEKVIGHLIDPIISYQEYCTRICDNSERNDELNIAINLFGLEAFENILIGTSKNNPINTIVGRNK